MLVVLESQQLFVKKKKNKVGSSCTSQDSNRRLFDDSLILHVAISQLNSTTTYKAEEAYYFAVDVGYSFLGFLVAYVSGW